MLGEVPNYEVDPYSGNLRAVHRDVVLKGNGGLDLVVHRVYDAAALFGLNELHSFRWVGLGRGWSLNVAPKVVIQRRWDLVGTTSPSEVGDKVCTGGSWTTSSTTTYVLEHVDGRRETLVPTGTGVVASLSNWKLTCDSALTYRLYSPDGTTYTLGQKHYRAVDGSFQDEKDLRFVLQATQVADRNGNTLSIAYTALGTTGYASYVSSGQSVRLRTAYLPSSVTASDGRSLSFSYDPGVPGVNSYGEGYAPRLLSINGPNGMVWRYNHAKHPNEVYDDLTEVIRPDGTSWRYAYDPPSASAGWRLLRTVTYPTGGVRTHEFEQATLYASCSINGEWDFVEGVRLKKVSTSDGGIWQYTYALGASNGAYDVTTVSTPSGVEIYRHIGVGYFTPASLGTRDLMLPIECNGPWTPNPWLLGLLAEKEIGSNFKEVTEWDSRLHSSVFRNSVLAHTGIREDTLQYRAPVVKKKTITLDGATYETIYSNHDQYGSPTTITESGPNSATRVTTVSYLNDTAKWIIGKVKDETFSGRSTLRSFDGNGNMTAISKDGVTTAFSYDSQGNVATATLPRGLVYSYSSYKRGVARTESQPDGVNLSLVVSDAGYITSETNGEGYTKSYTYDGLGRLTSIDYPQGHDATISYTATSKTQTRGSLVETTTYDGFGRISRRTAGGITTTYSHDPLGRKSFESNPDATIGTSYQYDALNRETHITNADSTYKAFTHGPSSVAVRDERAHVTTFNYRAFGNPHERTLVGIVMPIAASNVTIARGPDDLVSSITQAGVTRTYNYDSRKYLTSEINPETGTTTYERDAAGNMTARTIGGVRTDFGYNGHNQLSSMTYSDATPAATVTYSKTGKLKTVTSSTASRVLIYDANDNLTGESVSAGAITLSAQYGYTANDHLSSITYPATGRVVSYSPDVLGRPTQVSGYANTVTYWPSGQPREISYVNGVVTSYDQNARLWTSGFHTRRGGTYQLSSSYVHDGAGNVTSISDAVDATLSRSLGYDSLNRLTSASGPWGAGSFGYDAAGNISSQSLGSFQVGYAYSAQNRLSSVSGSRSSTFSYDGYGNISGASGNTYGYDSAQNLRCVNCPGSNRVEYGYDGLNRRVTVARGGATTYEIYSSAGHLLTEYTPSSDNRLIDYIYLDGKRIAQTMSDNRPATSVAFSSSVAVAHRTGGVTLTVNVGGSSPTGTVTFMAGGTFLGTAYVSDGRGSIDVQGLPLGVHTITAIYSGDFAHSGNTVTLQIRVVNLDWLPAVLDLLLE